MKLLEEIPDVPAEVRRMLESQYGINWGGEEVFVTTGSLSLGRGLGWGDEDVSRRACTWSPILWRRTDMTSLCGEKPAKEKPLPLRRRKLAPSPRGEGWGEGSIAATELVKSPDSKRQTMAGVRADTTQSKRNSTVDRQRVRLGRIHGSRLGLPPPLTPALSLGEREPVPPHPTRLFDSRAGRCRALVTQPLPLEPVPVATGEMAPASHAPLKSMRSKVTPHMPGPRPDAQHQLFISPPQPSPVAQYGWCTHEPYDPPRRHRTRQGLPKGEGASNQCIDRDCAGGGAGGLPRRV